MSSLLNSSRTVEGSADAEHSRAQEAVSLMNSDSVQTDRKRSRTRWRLSSKCLAIFLLIYIFSIALSVYLTALLLLHSGKSTKLRTDEVAAKSATDQYNDTAAFELRKESIIENLKAADLRLPIDLIPERYELRLKTHLPGYGAHIALDKYFHFDGQITIFFTCKYETNKIVLNSLDLTFERSANFNIQSQNGQQKIHVNVVKVDVNRQMVFFGLNETLQPEINYTFSFKYYGRMNDALLGFYVSQYTTSSGMKKYLAATQMEPTDARRMVPCFDEPSLKASWKLTIEHPEGTVALSNGIELTDNLSSGDDWVYTEFKETPKMSSYLLAVVICDFVFQQGYTIDNVRFRVWTRNASKVHSSQALEYGIRTIDYFTEYFSIPFPLEKQDMIALPDFEWEAMENWGLVTYREKYLLYTDTLYQLEDKRMLAMIIAHELAHQWFGNLVTMKWWDDLWLNEGFATFMQYLALDHITSFPMKEYFILETFEKALNSDQKETSHPLYVPIAKTSDIYSVFDEVSYEKGASVIWMMRNVIGEEAFRKGMKIYLNEAKFSNAAHTDLWRALTKAVSAHTRDWNGKRLNMTEFALSWTEQMAYPVIEMDSRSSTEIRLKQRRFQIDKHTDTNLLSSHEYRWHIPIWYEIDGEQQDMRWIPRNAKDIILNVPENATVLINRGVRGFYRVKYDEIMWRRLRAMLLNNLTSVAEVNRAQLINDAFALARAGDLEYNTAFALLDCLKNETSFFVWKNILDALQQLRWQFYDTAAYIHFLTYARSLLKSIYDQFNWNDLPDSYSDETMISQHGLQELIMVNYCDFYDSHCEKKAVQVFKGDFLMPCNNTAAKSSQCSNVPLLIRNLVYCKGVKDGGERAWNFVFQKYKTESIKIERNRLMLALTCAVQHWLITRTLNMAVDEKDVRKQDVKLIFSQIGHLESARPFLWSFFQSNFDIIIEKFGKSYQTFQTIVEASTNLNTLHEIDAYERLLSKYPNVTSKYSVFERQRESALSNIRWKKKNLNTVTNLLQRLNQ